MLQRLPSLVISTGITGLALEVNLLICRLQFQANSAQLISTFRLYDYVITGITPLTTPRP